MAWNRTMYCRCWSVTALFLVMTAMIYAHVYDDALYTAEEACPSSHRGAMVAHHLPKKARGGGCGFDPRRW